MPRLSTNLKQKTMKSIIQRVTHASVKVDDKIVGNIDKGFMILLGVGNEDNQDDIDYLVAKISQLRVFNDDEGKMNLDLLSIAGNCLVISQFTLFADTKKGNRPSFISAAPPAMASELYDKFCIDLSLKINKQVEKGMFGADMKVELLNDGPVTIIMDSKNR
jgi:D-aminoacyl-tRNA deacylase